jgi:tubulin polyglutamylase TTLL5
MELPLLPAIDGRPDPAKAAEVPRVRAKGELVGRPATSCIVFRPTRSSLAELWSDGAPRPTRSAEGWRLYYALASRGECRLLQTLLEDHGFVQTRARAFNLLWLNCPVKPALLLGLNKYQKVNHFPRTQELTRKDLLTRTLMAMREAHGSSACDFLPTTYVLPADAEACHNAMMRERGAAWIVKPIASSRGRGISIVQQPHQLPMDDVVVSRYVSNPLLIDGFKFDLRIYVAVTSFDPLRCYVFEEGLARFSTEPYQNVGGAALKNLFMHLTNYSINKHSSHFVHNCDATADDHGNKWSLAALRRCLARNGVDVEQVFARIDALVVRTLIAVEPSVTAACRRYCPHRNCAFELFGFDVLLDDQLKPWLLEVNLSPSLAADTPLDLKVKTRMLSDLLTLVNIVPYDREAHRVELERREKLRFDRLSRGEPATRQTLRHRAPGGGIDTAALSAEGQRAVADMDQEEERAGGYRRLFPTADGHAHRHLFATERPMNTLLVDVLRNRRRLEERAQAAEEGAAPDSPSASSTDLDAIAAATPPTATSVSDDDGLDAGPAPA